MMKQLLVWCVFLLLSASVVAQAPLSISTDQGASWQSLSEGLPSDLQVRDVVELDGATYLSAFGSGVYVLPKGETAWQSRSAGLPVSSEVDFFPTSFAVVEDRLVLGTFDHGVFTSDDAGNTWQVATANIPNVVSALLPLRDTLFAGTHSGLWQSLDGGTTWTERVHTGDRINALAVQDGHLRVAKQNGMGTLRGEGIAWAAMSTKWAIVQLHEEAGSVYAVTARDEVYRSADGQHWEQNTFVLPGLPASTLAKALWGGYVAKPSDQTVGGRNYTTSRGWWVGGRGAGC